MEIDFAMLADHAEVVNGKLYLMGGGWDFRLAPQVPALMQFFVAIGVRVGWEETNIPIALGLRLENDDGGTLFTWDGQVQVGRPPHVAAGASQLWKVAVAFQAELPALGGYRIVVSAATPSGATSTRTLPFQLVRSVPGAAFG